MLSWFLSTEDVEPALKLQRKLIVDQVQRHPDLVPSACIDDKVEIIAVRKYFTENAWQAVEAIL